jgi:acyl-CoA oxidase
LSCGHLSVGLQRGIERVCERNTLCDGHSQQLDTLQMSPKANVDDHEYPPELLPYLPLLYVVWQDGVLTDAEIVSLRQRIDDEGALTADNIAQLSRFLDPSDPPSAARLHEWRRVAERSVAPGDVPPKSLVELGMRLGQLRADDPSRRTLEIAERHAGFVSSEAAGALAPFREPVEDDDRAHPHFDVGQLTRHLYGDQTRLRNEVLEVLKSASFANAPVHDRDKYRAWVFDRIRELAARGWGSIAFPKDCGGQDDMRGFITVFETVALKDLSVVIKFGVQFGLFGGSIHQLGSPHQRTTFLRRIGEATLPGCFAMTETGHGSNVRDIGTTATYRGDTDTFVLQTPDRSAWKDYIGNAAQHGRVATVFAQLMINDDSMGVHAFIVPIRDDSGHAMTGVTIEDCGHKMGLNGVDNGRLAFSDVSIPRTNLLSRFGSVDADGTYQSEIASDGKRFFTMLATLVGGRVSVGLGALSAAKAGLTIAIRYGDRRRQFGPKGRSETRILDYLTHQRRLLPLLANSYALHLSLHRLADAYVSAETEEERQQVEVLAAGLKAYSTRNTTRTLQEARESCGGQGYLWENRFADLKADTDVFTTFEGDNTVLFLQVAKSLLGEYGHQFSNMDVFGYVRHFARLAALSALEKNPIVARQTDSDHLRDPETLESALRYRSESLLRSVARRMKHRIDNGSDSFHAFVDCQDHLLELAEAHTELTLLADFRRELSEFPTVALPQMRRLLALFGLATIERNRGWYLEQNYIEAPKSRAIRREVNRLLLEIRPDAVALVDAFAIPNAILGAPIAL